MVQIEMARAEDLPAIEQLLIESGLPTNGLAAHLGAAVVARDGGAVVGSAALELYGGDAALLRSVAVAPAWRGAGVAQQLLQAAARLASQRGVAALYLLTTTAEGYFPRYGFAKVDRAQVPVVLTQSVEFTSACPSSAAVLAAPVGSLLASASFFTSYIDIYQYEEGAMEDQIKLAVREHYGKAIQSAQPCCGSDCCAPDQRTEVALYGKEALETLPGDVVTTSFGCGNPLAIASLRPGEVVLDLGSGGGLDVMLSAQRVGASGYVYGLDMTDEMLATARRNIERAGISNAEFLKGEIEDIPLPNESVDVIISNCVINLSPDKGQVLRESQRVLRPGGRLAVSDIVVDGTLADLPLDEATIRAALSWVGCISGAINRDDYVALLEEAGFQDVDITVKHRYALEDLGEVPEQFAALDRALLQQIAQRFVSSSIMANKR